MLAQGAHLDVLKAKIRHVPDFPKAGILFYDVTTLLRDPEGFRVAIDSLCAGAGEEAVCLSTVAPELREGEHLVVLADLDDPEIAKTVELLNGLASHASGLAADTAGPKPWLLSASPSERHRAFFWQWGPSFQVVETPEALIRPLYRRLPRSFRVRDGQVTETFRGLPPIPN